MVTGEGWSIGNADCSVVCESPKLAPRRAEMQQRLSDAVGAPGVGEGSSRRRARGDRPWRRCRVLRRRRGHARSAVNAAPRSGGGKKNQGSGGRTRPGTQERRPRARPSRPPGRGRQGEQRGRRSRTPQPPNADPVAGDRPTAVDEGRADPLDAQEDRCRALAGCRSHGQARRRVAQARRQGTRRPAGRRPPSRARAAHRRPPADPGDLVVVRTRRGRERCRSRRVGACRSGPRGPRGEGQAGGAGQERGASGRDRLRRRASRSRPRRTAAWSTRTAAVPRGRRRRDRPRQSRGDPAQLRGGRGRRSADPPASRRSCHADRRQGGGGGGGVRPDRPHRWAAGDADPSAQTP